MPFSFSSKHFHYSCLLLGAVSILAPKSYGWDRSWFEHLDTKAIPCERPILLDPRSEVVFEVSNQVPGKDLYNKIVQSFLNKDYKQANVDYAEFEKEFPNSPLFEAAEFLKLNILFAQIEPHFLNAEEALRDADFLYNALKSKYPGSSYWQSADLIVGFYRLKHRQYQQALSQYSKTNRKIENSPFACAYLAGAAESSFLLKSWKEAERQFRALTGNTACKNRHIQAMARVRLSQIELEEGKLGSEQKLDRVVAQNFPFVENSVVGLLYELGETKYRLGKLSQAKYYFDSYIKQEREQSECLVNAYKRVADIYLQQGQKVQNTIAKYLLVYEKFPKDPIGKFSHGIGLILGLPAASEVDRDRRIKLVDEYSQELSGEYGFKLQFLKLLMVMDMGKNNAIWPLTRLIAQGGAYIPTTEIGYWVRRRILNMIETFTIAEPQWAIPYQPTEAEVDDYFLGPIEPLYASWFRRTKNEADLKKIYSERILLRFSEKLKDENYQGALNTLQRWMDSHLWDNGESLTEGSRFKIVELLLDGLIDSHEKAMPALLYAQRLDDLGEFLIPNFKIVSQLAWNMVGHEGMRTVAGGKPQAPKFEPYWDKVPPGLREKLKFAVARSQRLLGDYEQAQKTLDLVEAKNLKPYILREKKLIFDNLKNYTALYQASEALLSYLSEEEKKQELLYLKALAYRAKLWNKGLALLPLSQKGDFTPAEKNSFTFLASKSLYELNRCAEAMGYFETLTTLAEEMDFHTEARFLYGKCLVQAGKQDKALSLWKKVAASKDQFWSRLAKNELTQYSERKNP